MTTVTKVGQRINHLLDGLATDSHQASAEDWDTPIPLDDPKGPSFPVDALPGVVGDYSTAVAEETQTAIDMPASVALGTISAAAGGRYEVLIPEQGWSEPVHIQTVTAAEPAQRKTQIFRLITKPIVEYERNVNPDERRSLGQWESRGRMMEKQLANAESSGSKSDVGKISDTEALRLAAVEALEEHRVERPRVTQIITDDATPEAVKSLLAEQGGAIAAMSAESAFLSNTAGGRYSDSPNLDVLLNGHAADRIRVDRKGRPSETIERACLTLCLMVQPDVVRELGKSPGFIARGGAARLLPSFPADMLGRRRIDVHPVPPELSLQWATLVTTIVQRVPPMHNGSYVPWAMELGSEASALFREWRIWHESQMGRDGAYADIRDWAGKQPGAVLRIAGLLHIACHDLPEAVRISGETIDRAIRIVDYYSDHARIMYRLMRGRSNHGDARAVLAVIQGEGSPTTRRAIHRRLRGRTAFQSSSDLNEPLDLLEEYGWIRREYVSGDLGGRPYGQNGHNLAGPEYRPFCPSFLLTQIRKERPSHEHESPETRNPEKQEDQEQSVCREGEEGGGLRGWRDYHQAQCGRHCVSVLH
jgi:hypothetical protein